MRSYLPGVCVVIPITSFSAYGEQLTLCLESIKRQTLSEIDVVLSYMPTHPYKDMHLVGLMVANPGVAVVYARPEKTFHPAEVRNIGGRWSRREFVTFVDSDAVLHPHALEASISEGGPNIVTTIHTAMTAPGVGAQEYWDALRDPEAFHHLIQYSEKAPGTGCCTVTTTADFERVRGLHEGMVGYGPTDWEFTDRLVAGGFERKNLSAMYGIFNLHQNHDRPFQDKDPLKVPSRRRNRAVLEKSRKTKGLVRNGKRWGGC